MAENTIKDMTTNFGKLDKFEGHDVRRWQKKIHFLLTTLKVVYVLTTPMPELLKDATVEAIRIRAKWENDDYICRGHILNGMSDSLFDVYTNVESAKELWDSLESKAQDSDKGKGKEVGGPSVNMTEEGGKNKHHKQNKGEKRSNENNSGSSSNKKPKLECWKCDKTGHFKRDFRSGHVHYKRMLEMSKDDLIPAIDENLKKCTTYASRFCYVYLLQAKDEALDKFRIYKTKVELQQNDLIKTLHTDRGGEYYDPAEHSKAYRFYVIEPNDSISINSIIESRDAIFDENRFFSIPRPKDILPNVQESQMDDHTDDIPNEISEPRKEAIDDEIGYVMENNTWVLSDLPPGCKPLGCKWIFKRKMKVDGTIDKFKARLVIQGFRQKEGINYFDTYAPIARITTIRLLLALAAIQNLMIYQMDVKTAFLNGDLDEEVYMKQPEGFLMSDNEHKVFDKTKKVLSSRFLMKDMGEADVILGINIKRENKRIVIIESHYIKKILKKFNREDCSPDMTTNFRKLDKFEGHDFRRWRKKMHFLLTTLKVVYVLTTPMPELLKDATVEAIRIRSKWENDDYICRGHILNGMSNSLFDVYTNVESAKELWDSLESKYMAEDS
nr:zinc finger, CCHC-type [Tanacetum cinerariifolium]